MGEATVWDFIDFENTTADFVYEVVPCSDKRALATELTHRIPRHWWTTFSSLARAYNLLVKREQLGYGEQNPHYFGRLVDDSQRLNAGTQTEWSVPWHRMRDMQGHCRSPREPGKVVRSNANGGNVRWLAEGGRLTKVGGQASFAQQFDVDQAIKRGPHRYRVRMSLPAALTFTAFCVTFFASDDPRRLVRWVAGTFRASSTNVPVGVQAVGP